MSTETKRRLFSVDDYMRMGKAGILGPKDRVELIHGEILAMSPVGSPHGAAVARAARELIGVVGKEAIVWIQSSIQLDDWNAPEPDIALLKPRDDFYAARLPLPEDILLVVEIAESSLEYDRGMKAGLYSGAGIPEYWVADLAGERLYVYSSPEDGVYKQDQPLQRGDRLAPHRLRRSEILVDSLLA